MRKVGLILGFIVVTGGICFISSNVQIAQAQVARKDAYYCPMHPAYTSDRPGTCPICNMNLIKKELKNESLANVNVSHATVNLDLMKRQMIGITTAEVQERKLIKTIRAYGKVSRDERWIFAEVFEYERPFLYVAERPLIGLQQKVVVDLPALPGQTFSGKVRLIDNDIDPVTRTTRVRIELTRWSKSLKPNMSVNVNIKADLGNFLVVPQSAVMDTGTRQVVFVDKGKGVLEPREVVLGEQGDEGYQVINGLRAGEYVVVGGNFMLDSESRLKAVLENTASMGGHNHGQ